MSPIHTEELQDRYLRRIPLGNGGFRYVRPDGRPYRDRAGLARIAALAVPPAYTEVYVSPDPQAELQAFGRDAQGRRQYRYHPDFVQRNARRKWRRLARFGAALPRLRALVQADLRRAGLPRQKVLALLVRLLDRIPLRVGSPTYARRYRSYGLTTLCKRHVRLNGRQVLLRYRGKHGVPQEQAIRDRSVALIITRLLALPGTALFQYQDETGNCHPLRASELNAYLREAIGPFTAKDFRTWGGTLKAAEFLAASGPPDGQRSAAGMLVRCVKEVAALLGNTPAVTRSSYICPVIFDLYLAGRLPDAFAARVGEEEGLSAAEAALRRLLASARHASALVRPSTPRGRRPRSAFQGVPA